ECRQRTQHRGGFRELHPTACQRRYPRHRFVVCQSARSTGRTGGARCDPRNLFSARVCRHWWTDELRRQSYGCLPAGRRQPRPDSQGREANRSAGPTGSEIGVCDQSQGCQGARPDRAGDAARGGRRGDRMSRAAMRRREFITLIGGAAAAWPLAAETQQPGRVRRLGFLISSAETDQEARNWITAFERRFAELGWTDGRNVRIEYRFGGGDATRMRQLARELLELQPDAVLASATMAATAVRQQTL